MKRLPLTVISLLLTLIICTFFNCKKNRSPDVPSEPSGPLIGIIDSNYSFSSYSIDSNNDSLTIRFDWGDGDTSNWGLWVANEDLVSMSHSWSITGTYFIKAQAKDEVGATSNWSEPHLIVITTNQPPDNPSEPLGANFGRIGILYTFTCKAIDADTDKVSIRFAWGNNDTSDWSAWVSSGDSVSTSYTWTLADTYFIRAQAKDFKGVTSAWSAGHKIIITNVTEGTLKWRCQIENLVWTSVMRSSPAISSEDVIYIGSRDGDLYAINYDGNLLWRFPTAGGVYSSSAIDHQGSIYIGSDDCYLYAVNPDGTLKWQYKTDAGIYSTPALGSDIQFMYYHTTAIFMH